MAYVFSMSLLILVLGFPLQARGEAPMGCSMAFTDPAINGALGNFPVANTCSFFGGGKEYKCSVGANSDMCTMSVPYSTAKGWFAGKLMQPSMGLSQDVCMPLGAPVMTQRPAGSKSPLYAIVTNNFTCTTPGIDIQADAHESTDTVDFNTAATISWNAVASAGNCMVTSKIRETLNSDAIAGHWNAQGSTGHFSTGPLTVADAYFYLTCINSAKAVGVHTVTVMVRPQQVTQPTLPMPANAEMVGQVTAVMPAGQSICASTNTVYMGSDNIMNKGMGMAPNGSGLMLVCSNDKVSNGAWFAVTNAQVNPKNGSVLTTATLTKVAH